MNGGTQTSLAARRYVPEWEREHRRLQAFRRTRRRADVSVDGYDYEAAMELLRASVASFMKTPRPIIDPDALEPYAAHRRQGGGY